MPAPRPAGSTRWRTAAGLAKVGPIERTGFDRWHRGMATDLDGADLTSQTPMPALKVAWGATRRAIIGTAAISTQRARTRRAGAVQPMRRLAVWPGEHGIRATCIRPAPLRKKLAMAGHARDIIDACHDASPLDRSGPEEENAEAIVWVLGTRRAPLPVRVQPSTAGSGRPGSGCPASAPDLSHGWNRPNPGAFTTRRIQASLWSARPE